MLTSLKGTTFTHMKKTCFLFFLMGVAVSVLAQNQLDKYVIYASENQIETLLDPGGIVTSPVDLDFHPDTINRPDELWVLNQGTEQTGGHTVVFNNINTAQPRSRKIQDGNAWHFMALASSMAFGSNGNWATAQDIQDANHSGGAFTGPALWSSDTTVYGVIGNPPTAQTNGSRIDVCHQSPYGKGIAYETDNVYWLMDGYLGTLKRYDFKKLRAPGELGNYDTEVAVYTDFSFTMDTELPAHIVIDENQKWLYGCDTKGKNVFRIDITSGSYEKDLSTVTSEPLGAYEAFTGHTQEVLFTENLDRPVGIDIQGDRLIVSDFGLAELILYDLQNMEEVGRISLKSITGIGVKGVKIGAQHKIYICDDGNDQVHVLDNPKTITPTGVDDVQSLGGIQVFPNPVREKLNFTVKGQNATYNVFSVAGEILMGGKVLNGTHHIPTSSLDNGLYLLSITSEEGTSLQRFQVIK